MHCITLNLVISKSSICTSAAAPSGCDIVSQSSMYSFIKETNYFSSANITETLMLFLYRCQFLRKMVWLKMPSHKICTKT